MNIRSFVPWLSAVKRCSFAIAGAMPSVIAASPALIPIRSASGFVTRFLILEKTCQEQEQRRHDMELVIAVKLQRHHLK